MDIWIIQDGEKSGPIHDYEVRRKIETGECPATTPAWHEGLDGWKPLGELPLFEGEFEKPQPAPESPYSPPSQEPSAKPPPLPGQAFLGRRFWARWFDLSLYAGVWWFGLWAVGQDIGFIVSSLWILPLQYVPWFALETVLLHRYGTTPGKWLLGIRVVNDDGSLMQLPAATLRSARVFIIGLGLGWGVLALVCQIMALITTRRLGRPLWDQAGGHRLEVAPLRPARVVSFVVLFFAALQLQLSVVSPYTMESAVKLFPELKSELEKNPPWHLPVRH